MFKLYTPKMPPVKSPPHLKFVRFIHKDKTIFLLEKLALKSVDGQRPFFLLKTRSVVFLGTGIFLILIDLESCELTDSVLK